MVENMRSSRWLVAVGDVAVGGANLAAAIAPATSSVRSISSCAANILVVVPSVLQRGEWREARREVDRAPYLLSCLWSSSYTKNRLTADTTAMME